MEMLLYTHKMSMKVSFFTFIYFSVFKSNFNTHIFVFVTESDAPYRYKGPNQDIM